MKGPQIDRPADLRGYLGQFRPGPTADGMPDLRWFFFVQSAFLWRRQINYLIGLSGDGRTVVGDADY